ncbi:MAG: hypothetical protein J1F18_05085 [Lachnospiraceae bacterium]|nr:hypothetical protein [Lachnospiraceae bacterium]
MNRKRYQRIRYLSILTAVTLAVFSLYPVKAFAVETIMLPTQVVGDDVVSMGIPIVSDSETSVFDFILDPQRLLYRTDAVRYGGGVVEEDATLLFYNKEGEYDFSQHSDWLTVTNRSTVPVRVTITARVMDIGDIKLVESADFAESTEPDVYLAIVDDQGNIQPLSADGQASVSFEMDAAPENTYVFRLDEETHTYQYGMSMNPNRINFDTYSFGLIGACNSDAEWQDLSVHPMITVTWYVEPIIPEEQEEAPVEDDNMNSESDAPDDDKSVDESTNKNVDEKIDKSDENNQRDESNQGDGSGQGDESNREDESNQGDGSNQDDEKNQDDERDQNNDNIDDTLENDNVQNEDVADGE